MRIVVAFGIRPSHVFYVRANSQLATIELA